VVDDLQQELRAHLDKISADLTVLGRLETLLQSRREQMLRQIGGLVREVEGAYGETVKERAELVARRLSWFRSFALILRPVAGRTELQTQIETQLRQLMQPQIEKAIRTLETDLRALWPQLQDLLENQLSAELQKESRQTLPDFGRQRRELSDAIQGAFINTLTGDSLRDQLTRCFSRTSFSLRIVTAITLIAGLVAFFAKIPVMTRVSIGIAVTGALAAVVLALNHRRKVLRECEQQLNPKQAEFTRRLEKEFTNAIDSFCGEMADKFRNLTHLCQDRQRRYQPWSERAIELETKLRELKV